MKSTLEIDILPFQPGDQLEVKNLILAGLAEHWGMLDPEKNPDLSDIRSTYAHGLFLVAWHENRIVGSGALVPKLGDIGEIVRMSVAANMRRQGVGRTILQRLIEQARSKGYQSLVLETTDTWHYAITFYQTFGFQIAHSLNGDVYFALNL